MLSNKTPVSELTVEELLALIRQAVRDELALHDQRTALNQRILLELEPLSVGAWPEGLKLLSRDEYYDNESVG